MCKRVIINATCYQHIYQLELHSQLYAYGYKTIVMTLSQLNLSRVISITIIKLPVIKFNVNHR